MNSSLKAGVIGWPIAHSKSPVIHGYWLKALNIDGEYTAIASKPDAFAQTIRALQEQGFKGANVTIPFKGEALASADEISPAAAAIGAANTLTFRSDGTIHADNTDGLGFINNLKQNAPTWSAASGPALVLGAGGAARAILFSLISEGVPKIYLTNRSKDRAKDLAQEFGPNIAVLDWEDRHKPLPDATTIINTTALGMLHQPALEFDLSTANPAVLVTDIVYNPLETNLLKAAKTAGLKTVDGLGMLLHQAVPGFARWFGVNPCVTDDLRQTVVAQL